jgi:hypothetical protein
MAAQEERMLLTSRRLIQRKLIDLERAMRGTLRNFGLRGSPHRSTSAQGTADAGYCVTIEDLRSAKNPSNLNACI